MAYEFDSYPYLKYGSLLLHDGDTFKIFFTWEENDNLSLSIDPFRIVRFVSKIT